MTKGKNIELPETLIFKISYNTPKILPYFEHFANFINHIYAQLDNFSIIELIENGFLWIFRDEAHFRQSLHIFLIFAIMRPRNF